METADSDHIINESLEILNDSGLSYQVGPLSTKISGPPEIIWDGLRKVFEHARNKQTEVAMVVTIANSRL